MALSIGVAGEGAASGTTTVSTNNISPTTGSTFIIICIFDAGQTFSTVTDNGGNSYTIVGSETSSGNGTSKVRAYRKINGTGWTTNSASFSCTGSGTMVILFIEIKGASTSDPGALDTNTATLDNSSPFSSGRITTTNANDALIGYTGGSDSVSATASHATNSVGTSPNETNPTTGWTLQTGAEITAANSFWDGAIATQIVAATSSVYQSAWTTSGGSAAMAGIIAIKEAAAGGGGVSEAARSPGTVAPGKYVDWNAKDGPWPSYDQAA